MLLQIFNVIAPVFIVAGIGYAWYRRGLPFDNATIGGLVMTVGAPCLVFSSLTGIDVDAQAFRTVAAAAAACIVGMLLIGALTLKLAGMPLRVYLPTLVQPNTGNMGLPLTFMAFGEAGLALGVCFYAVNSVSQYTLGLALASGAFEPARLLRQPVIWALLAALLARAEPGAVPLFVSATAELLAGFVIPAMLLMLGTSIARLKLAGFARPAAMAVLRVLGGVALGYALVWLLDLEGIAAGVVIIQSAMPAAVFNIVFAEQFDNEPEQVAGVILLSTLLSFVTLPLLVAFALSQAAGS